LAKTKRENSKREICKTTIHDCNNQENHLTSTGVEP